MNLTANEKRTVRAVFGELVKMRYADLNKVIGSSTIDEMHKLYSKLENEEYCDRHGITYEEMTDDDFINAYFEKYEY